MFDLFAWFRRPVVPTVQERKLPMTTLEGAPPWYNWALKELGVHEVGENRGPNIRRYIGLAKCGEEGQPWCAIFANAGFEASGFHGTRSPGSQSFRTDEHFVKLPGPALGAVTVFWRNSPSSGLGHVGFYAGESGGYVHVLGGNEGDMVQIEPFPKQSAHFALIGYWWPKGAPLPHIGHVAASAASGKGQGKVT